MCLAAAPDQSKEHIWWKQYRNWKHLERFSQQSRQVLFLCDPPLQCWTDILYCLQERNYAFRSLPYSKTCPFPSEKRCSKQAIPPKGIFFYPGAISSSSVHTLLFRNTAWVTAVILRSGSRRLGSSSLVLWTGPQVSSSGNCLGRNTLAGSFQAKSRKWRYSRPGKLRGKIQLSGCSR